MTGNDNNVVSLGVAQHVSTLHDKLFDVLVEQSEATPFTTIEILGVLDIIRMKVGLGALIMEQEDHNIYD